MVMAEISLNGSLVMNIRCGTEILLSQHDYINQKSDPPFHLQQLEGQQVF